MRPTSSLCRRSRGRFLTVAAVALLLCLTAPLRVAAVEGVTVTEITLGVSSAFKGPSAALGSELYRGYMAYFRKVNDGGGIHGRSIRLVTYDDSYDPPQAVQNTIKLITQDKVFMLFGNVGTPTTVQVLPLLKKYEDRRIFLFSPFTGAQPHREEPYDAYVFNVRASYRQETKGLVDMLVAGDLRKIGVFFQSDSYGKSGEDGVHRALQAHGLSIAAEATYARGAKFETPLTAQAGIMKDSGCQAVIAIGAYAACSAFIRDLRDAGFKGPIANISFVGSEAMLGLLKDYGQKIGRDYTAGLINSQVVPYYGRSDIAAALEYRDLVQRYQPEVPAELKDPDYRPSTFSFGSFEGYLDARVLVEVLNKAGADLTPETFKTALESMESLDAGLDVPLSFGPAKHQGLDKVYFTTVSGGSWTPLNDLRDLSLPR